MVVINGEELVIVLLPDFVGDCLTVDNRRHRIFRVFFVLALFGRDALHINLAHINLTSVFTFAVPALVGSDAVKVLTIHHRIALRGQFLTTVVGGELLLLKLLLQLRCHCEVDLQSAVKVSHRHVLGKIIPDDAVEYFKTLLDGCGLYGVARQHICFGFAQTVLQGNACACRVHGERACLLVDYNAVRLQALQPLLRGEIHR